MSENRIDPLAVMDSLLAGARSRDGISRGDEARATQARAAVAELIEAADGVRGAARISDWRRLEAALAAVRP